MRQRGGTHEWVCRVSSLVVEEEEASEEVVEEGEAYLTTSVVRSNHYLTTRESRDDIGRQIKYLTTRDDIGRQIKYLTTRKSRQKNQIKSYLTTRDDIQISDDT